jgi:D-alanyl-D-alanine-carboxypeptidase/D-alanyl-D-alanine-endopeptidase
MMTPTQPVLAIALCCLVGAAGCSRTPPTDRERTTALPPDEEVHRILAERVDAQGDGIGMVVGLIGPAGRRIVSYGARAAEDRRALDGDTLFEIGSITKALTAVLLVDMAGRGEVRLTDPVANYLPDDGRAAVSWGRTFTFLELATHHSGLPMMPPPAMPHYAFIASLNPMRDGEPRFEYSNLGYWLLAQGLVGRSGTNYETLLATRVTGPLHMTSTTITVPPERRARVAIGHDSVLNAAPSVSDAPLLQSMPEAGAVVSSANDLLTFLSAALRYTPSPLAPAIAATVAERRPTSDPRVEQALAWTIVHDPAGTFVVHDGGTLGFASSIAWDPAARVGVVVLSNHVVPVGDIARHLLRPATPLAPPVRRPRAEVTLAGSVLDAVAGDYRAEGEGVFAIAREGSFLTITAPEEWGLPRFRLRPEGPRDFFVSELPLRVQFQGHGSGRATGMLIHPPNGNRPIRADRIE